MAMFLTILLWSLLVLAACCAIFARTVPEAPRPDLKPGRDLALDPPRFFAGDAARPRTGAEVPIEVVLSQIERHVRLEQAAAESFLELPTAESLHSKTSSPLLN